MEQDVLELVEPVAGGALPEADALFAALYSKLHRLAAHQLARSGRDLTLSPTTVLHEAYVDMSGRDTSFSNWNQFMAYASKVMRAIIVDYARRKRRHKHGGGFEFRSIEGHDIGTADFDEVTEIGAAVEELAKVDPALAEIVDLKFFCGFSFGEIAAMRGVCERTVQRQWRKARAYLRQSMDV